ncbi:hypothetical protein GCM10009106_04860 [Sphingomonas japonica]
MTMVLAAAFALSACNVRSDEEAAALDGETAAASGDNAADLTPEEAGIFDKLLNNGTPMKLSVEQIHPNGGVLRLNSIQVKPTETVVNMTYVNGHRREVQLNWANYSKHTYLLANNRKFFLSPPITDEDVKIASGATVTGDLVFIGAVPEGPQVQLVINENGGTSEGSYNPKFVVDIPVTTAAYSDDGSKKKSVA